MHIGLTGGIGSGKSTAAAALVGLGWHLVDTDAIARSLTAAGGAALPAIAEHFGADLVDSQQGLNRTALRQQVFADPNAKRALEAILHPMILAEANRQAQGHVHTVFDVPLLTESQHWRARVQRVLLVDCDEAVQVQRVAQRPGWSASQALAVMATQATRAQRRQIADAVIDNSLISHGELVEMLTKLTQEWQTPVKESRS